MKNQYLKFSIMLFCILTIYAGFLIYISRYHFLDDAFIHLRIAENALNGYGLTFNKQSDSFATSSPLYSFLLMTLLANTDGPFLTKYISVFAYFGLLLQLFLLLKHQKNDFGLMLTFIFLSAITSPIGVRWLSDGMETVLVANGAMFLGFWTSNFLTKDTISTTKTVILSAFIFFLLVLLRLEFFLVAVMVASISFYQKLKDTKALASSIKAPVFILLGCVLAITFVYFNFGQVLPDTASAKSNTLALHNALENTKYFTGIAVAHVSAGYFGISLLVCLVGSSIFLFKSEKYRFYVFFNIFFLLALFVLMYVRQQHIQGVRYFIFIEFYIISLSLWVMSSDEFMKIKNSKYSKNMMAISIFICIFIANAFDYRRFEHIVSGRSATLQNFILSDLSDLERSVGIAYDIGMVGYFTSATILDPNGLIHGKALANMSKDERIEWICNQHSRDVKFVFLNDAQQREISKCLDTYNWKNYGEYSFPNYGGSIDTHFLLVRPTFDG